MNKLLLIFFVLLLYSPTSFSCSCKLKSVAESFSDSKAVLLIEVQKLEVFRNADDGTIKYLEAKFKTVESFMEAEDDINVLRTYSNCGLELYPSQKYLVYVPKESTVKNYVSRCHGSFKYLPQVEYTRAKLDAVRKFAHNKSMKKGT